MSVTEKLYCACEKVMEGESEAIPRYVAQIVLNYGEKILDEKNREEIIKECETKQRQLEIIFGDLKEKGDEYQHKLNQLMFWKIMLPKTLDDPKGFYSVVDQHCFGFDQNITRNERKILLESYGSPQLREYIERRKIEAADEMPKVLDSLFESFREMGEIWNRMKEVRKSIQMIKDFDSIIESLDNEDFDPNLSEKFIERMFLSRSGIRLKVE